MSEISNTKYDELQQPYLGSWPAPVDGRSWQPTSSCSDDTGTDIKEKITTFLELYKHPNRNPVDGFNVVQRTGPNISIHVSAGPWLDSATHIATRLRHPGAVGRQMARTKRVLHNGYIGNHQRRLDARQPL